jgi:DNA processing protein
MPLPPAGAEPEAWLALDLIPGLGPENFRRLLSQFGPPGSVISQSAAALAPVVGVKLAEAIARGGEASRLSFALSWLEQADNHILTLADEDYPRSLLQTADPPVLLYLKGRRELLRRPAIAIVGSRNATPVGCQNAEAFAKALSEAGLTVVSGLALGIDAAAHRGGLQGSSSSIAVVGTGLDLIYPARNKELARDLAAQGLIVSEFSLGTPAIAANFPRRNRIISGMSKGVLVVEAALASGSLITARLAGEQGRDVFAIPGSIHSPFSKGCHHLIKQGAKLVDDATDILIELGFENHSAIEDTSNQTVIEHASGPLLKMLGYDPVTVESLISLSGLPTEAVLGQLTQLELEGAVASMPGGKYQRIR